MQPITLDNISQAVINHGDRGASHPRLYEIYTSLIQHLHDFAREVKLTEQELQAGRDFINQASHHTQEIPTGEIHMLTDLLGISELVELLHDDHCGTEDNLEGPLRYDFCGANGDRATAKARSSRRKSILHN